MSLWPCSTCGQPGVRNLGARGYCTEHLIELLASFTIGESGLPSIGMPIGLQRPEFGAGCEDLACVVCGATWVGRAGKACGYCERYNRMMCRWQGEMLLAAAELPAPGDRRRPDALKAWSERLAVAVAAGIVSDWAAEQALVRERAR